MDTTTPINPLPAAGANLLTLGADLVGQVQRIIGRDKVRALRVKLGGRTVTEIPVAPLSAAATVALVVLAVVLSTLSVEVEHEPSDAAGEAAL